MAEEREDFIILADCNPTMERFRRAAAALPAACRATPKTLNALRFFAQLLQEIDEKDWISLLYPGITQTQHEQTGAFTEHEDIEAEGTGKMVSADDLDALFAEIDKLTQERSNDT